MHLIPRALDVIWNRGRPLACLPDDTVMWLLWICQLAKERKGQEKINDDMAEYM